MLVAAVRAFVGSAAFVFPGRGPGWRGGAACAFWGSVCWGCLPGGLAGTPAGALQGGSSARCPSGWAAGALLAHP